MKVETNVKAGFKANRKDIPAGPIWSDSDAAGKCPKICKANGGGADGNWVTVVPGKMSVCGCFL